MRRHAPLAFLALATGASVLVGACSKESARATTEVDPCLLNPCDTPDAATPPKADASVYDAGTRDAAIGDAGPPGTGVTEWDGFVPPVDGDIQVPIRDAQWDPDGVSGPTGPINGGPLPESTSCGAGPVAFSTSELAVITSGAAALPAAFANQWSAAVARAGSPGPALVVLGDTGAVDGGSRRFRFGAPVSTGSSYAFVSQANNPFASTWSFVPLAYVEAKAATTANVNAAILRFRTATGSTVDVPVVDAALQGAIRGNDGDAALCTGLGNTVLSLVIPASAGGLVLEGQTLDSTLGGATRQPSGVVGWTVRLAGSLPKVAFAGALP
jgi:hypothetical protein